MDTRWIPDGYQMDTKIIDRTLIDKTFKRKTFSRYFKKKRLIYENSKTDKNFHRKVTFSI